jgi:hypothetical protein
MTTARITVFARWLPVALLICFVLAGPRTTAAVTALSGQLPHISDVPHHRDPAHWSVDAVHTAALGAVVFYHVVRWFAPTAAPPPAFSPASTTTGRAPPSGIAQAD